MLKAEEDGLDTKHENEQNSKQQARSVLPILPIQWHAEEGQPEKPAGTNVLERVLHMEVDPLTHAARVDKAPAGKHGSPQCLGGLPVDAQVVQDRLGSDENTQGEEEPRLAEEENTETQAAPKEIRDETEDWMTYYFRVTAGNEPRESLGKLPLGVHHKVPDVVINSPLAIVGRARAPDEPVQKIRQQCWCIATQPADEILVPAEHGIHPIVVPISVGANGEQVDNDRLCSIQGARLDRPKQR
mmetsp:Transcript_9747/g.27275  ORF Transcript_9747/g.27275 Transcript_9747/m.27275 type:complete len:243 (-) Transcript_9747:405-1133(-)